MSPYMILTGFEHVINMFLPRSVLRRRQLARFRKLVGYVSRHSPYYAEIIRDRAVRIESCVPEDFPVVTKSDVIHNFDRIVTDREISTEGLKKFLKTSTEWDDLYLGRYYVTHTSGSSGEVGYNLYTHRELTRAFSRYVWVARLSYPTRLVHIATTGGHYSAVTMLSYLAKHLPRTLYKVLILDVNQPTPRLVDELNAFQPTALTGYARAIRVAAEAQDRGDLHIRPNRIMFGGEPMLAADREFVQRVFEAPITNVYAASEHLVMGIGRPDFGGILLMEDDMIFDLREDHTLVTNLCNYALPLIRYRMEDVMEATKPSRFFKFRRVKGVLGRFEDAPVFVNRHGAEDYIHPCVITEILHEELRGFQFQIMDKTSFVFRSVLTPGLPERRRKQVVSDLRATLDAMLAEKEMQNVAYQVEIVSELGVDPKTGKFRLVLRPEAEAGGVPKCAPASRVRLLEQP